MLLLLYWNFSPECCMMFVIHYSRAVLIATQAFNCKSTVKVAFLWALCALTEQIKDTLLLRLQCFFFLPTPNAEHPKMGNDIIVFANYALQGTTNSAIPSRRCPPPSPPPSGNTPLPTNSHKQYPAVLLSIQSLFRSHWYGNAWKNSKQSLYWIVRFLSFLTAKL